MFLALLAAIQEETVGYVFHVTAPTAAAAVAQLLADEAADAAKMHAQLDQTELDRAPGREEVQPASQ